MLGCNVHGQQCDGEVVGSFCFVQSIVSSTRDSGKVQRDGYKFAAQQCVLSWQVANERCSYYYDIYYEGISTLFTYSCDTLRNLTGVVNERILRNRPFVSATIFAVSDISFLISWVDIRNPFIFTDSWALSSSPQIALRRAEADRLNSSKM